MGAAQGRGQRAMRLLLLLAAPLLAEASLLVAVRSVLAYYSRHKVTDNFLFGLVLAEGQLYATKLINKGIEKEINMLLSMCDMIIESNPRFWLNKHVVKKVGKALVRLKTKQSKLIAPELPPYRLERNLLHGSPSRGNSSLCILEAMMGKHMSDMCMRQETDKEARGYSLSHQILYFSIASAMSPFPFITEEVIPKKCAKVLSEVNYSWEKGIPTDLVDLFIEEVAVCGMNNYKEFLTEPILDFVLSLQHEDGCFALTKEGPLSECDDHLSSTSLVSLTSFLYAITESKQNII